MENFKFVTSLIRSSIGLCLTVLLLSSCTSLPEQGPRIPSYASDYTNSIKLAQAIDTVKSEDSGLSGFHLLRDGLDAFVARAVLAERAERSIDAQYYLWHNDLVGRLMAGLLVKAADRGVRVRLLVDDMALADGDYGATALNAHPNIEVRIFNPFFRSLPRTAQLIARFGSVTRRMHNKSFTADNQATVVGGRNIGDEYFNADLKMNFGDLDVLGVGPVVDDVSTAFDLYWNHRLAYSIDTLAPTESKQSLTKALRERTMHFRSQQAGSDYLMAVRNSELATAVREQTVKYVWGKGVVVYDDPDKLNSDRGRTDLHLVTQLRKHFSDIEQELIIFSPYFVPGKAGVAWLKDLRDKGISVRILTNSLAATDVSVVHAGYARYRKSLLKAGVELWEFDKELSRDQRKALRASGGSSKASLHAKSFLIDRSRIFVGSVNLDPRSIVENSELGIMIESAELASELSNWFDRKVEQIAFRLDLERGIFGRNKIVWHKLEDGAYRDYTTEPGAGFWRRLSVMLLRWLPIESQL